MTHDDEVLLPRIRRIMKRLKGYSEKKMFGGVGFFIDDHMCLGPWKGSLVVRLSKQAHEATQSEPHVSRMNITGKVMKGWALVAPAGIATELQLKTWIMRAVQFVRSLEVK